MFFFLFLPAFLYVYVYFIVIISRQKEVASRFYIVLKDLRTNVLMLWLNDRIRYKCKMCIVSRVIRDNTYTPSPTHFPKTHTHTLVLSIMSVTNNRTQHTNKQKQQEETQETKLEK